ncbi:sulfotransferase domain-containing protein [Paracoccus aminovorans]|uniref:sulfotransferase domain-containing protein n=1 Tax=Paracoccus aminovorans TaxID=34004 RepID=UPI000785040C|nr:sulfotransferase domain-containing protein [Paracoccus aminovorans]
MRGYLFCIGAAKSGTTWLYEQLRHSPEIYFSPEKELHYFFSRYGSFDRLPNNTRFRSLQAFVNLAAQNYQSKLPDGEYARKFSFFEKNLSWYQNFARGPVCDSWYRQLFGDARPHQYACDFSPSTSKIGLDGVHAIRALGPNVKLIYILRNPVKRLWSHLKFHAEFMGRWEEVRNYSPDQMLRFIKDFDLDEDGKYARHLERFLQVFDRKDVLVLDFDDIRSEPTGLMAKVADFLDIRPLQLPESAREAVNVSSRMDMPQGLLDGFKSEMLRDTRILDGLGVDFVRKWYSSLE